MPLITELTDDQLIAHWKQLHASLPRIDPSQSATVPIAGERGAVNDLLIALETELYRRGYNFSLKGYWAVKG